jgi:hypothetical protein
MTWTSLSRHGRQRAYLEKIHQWHRKFAWFPIRCRVDENSDRWFWLCYVTRRAVFSQNYDARYPWTAEILHWEYASDDFDLIKKMSE